VPTAAKYLDELNPEQRRAVEHGVTPGCSVGPPLLVIAGAGSGKTNTLAHRVAHLIVTVNDLLATGGRGDGASGRADCR
jgi:DNA helicase-2/ATP-dependent DNA helicase PcrA